MLWLKSGIILGVVAFLCYTWHRAYTLGKKQEQLERLRREVNERRRAHEMFSNVVNLNHDELNARVHSKRKTSKRGVRTKN